MAVAAVLRTLAALGFRLGGKALWCLAKRDLNPFVAGYPINLAAGVRTGRHGLDDLHNAGRPASGYHCIKLENLVSVMFEQDQNKT